MFLDHELQLNIYDISQYKIGNATKINRIAYTNVYNSSSISTLKYCSSLTVLIEGRIYVVFCLSNEALLNTTLVSIDVSVENFPIIKY